MPYSHVKSEIYVRRYSISHNKASFQPLMVPPTLSIDWWGGPDGIEA